MGAVLELLSWLLDLTGWYWPRCEPPREQLTVLGDINPPRA